MMLLKQHLILSAILALLIPTPAALKIPLFLRDSLSLTPINNTSPSAQASPHPSQSLTFSHWPPRPYEVPLHGRFDFFDLVIMLVEPWHGSRPISVPGLQHFLKDFSDNIEREYPIPGEVPRLAKQSYIDTESYTTWTIDINEGLFGNRLPTEWALLALKELARQLGKHGPAEVYFSIKRRASTYTYGFLFIKDLGGASLNPSLTSGESKFQTS